jgi:hypothetical protein
MTGFLPSETARHHQAEVVGLLDAAIKQAKVDLCLKVIFHIFLLCLKYFHCFGVFLHVNTDQTSGY